MAEQWYYAQDGQPKGPITVQSLQQLVHAGQLHPPDLVWTEGMSDWAPAEWTRGIVFPRAAAGLPLMPLEETAPRPEQKHPSRRGPAVLDVRKAKGGSSRNTTLGIGLVILLIVVVVIGAGVVAAQFFPRRGPQAGFRMPPARKQQAPFMVPPVPQRHSYEIDFTFEGQSNVRRISLEKNQRVQVTVTTSRWGGGPVPDVDLYIYDPNEREIAKDIDPAKDCDVSFTAPVTGEYQIVVRLDQGTQAHCIVRY